MATVIFASTPAVSAVRPLLAVAASLARRGRRVYFLAAPDFRGLVERAGVVFVPMGCTGSPGGPDARLAAEVVDRRPSDDDLPSLCAGLRDRHIDPIADQHAALQALLTRIAGMAPEPELPVLVHDTMFLGAWPLHLGAEGRRFGTELALGVTPLPWPTVDAASLVDLQADLDRVLSQCGATTAAPLLLSGVTTLPDCFLQLSISAMERPARGTAHGVTFVGHIPPTCGDRGDDGLPPWWPDLDTARPVVLVTPGPTVGGDLDRLTRASLHALRHVPVLIVVAVDWDAARFGPLPDHARAAANLPLAALLPFVDVVISNGDFDDVQHALAHGVPVIVAADSGPAHEVGRYVAQAQAGAHLTSSLPSSDALRETVRSVVDSATALAGARALRNAYANHDAIDTVTGLLTPRHAHRGVVL